MHEDELDRLLETAKPPVAARSQQLTAALADLQRSVESRVTRSPRKRKARVVVGGLSLAAAMGAGAAAAAVDPSLWSEGADVKRISTTDGTQCESVITVSDGLAPHGSPAEVAAKQKEARSVAKNLLRSYEYVPDEVASELQDADYVPVENLPESPRELSAFFQLATETVSSELDRRGLPEVNLAMESACGENLR